MSYILDALQKADQKRQRDSVPDLQTVHSPGPPKKRKSPLWPWLLMAAFMINVVLLILLLPGRRHDNILTVSPPAEINNPVDSRPSVEENRTTDGRTARNPLSKSTTGAAVVGGESIPAAGPTAIPADTDTLPAVNPVTGPSTIQEPTSSIPVAAANVSLANRPESLNQPDDMYEEKIPPTRDDAMTSSVVPESLTDITEPEGEQAAVEIPPSIARIKPENEIPLLASLPRSLREAIPELTISFHAYTQNPATRLVSINGRIIRQGQEVAPKLTLEEITAKGVIFNYKGDRFRMEVF